MFTLERERPDLRLTPINNNDAFKLERYTGEINKVSLKNNLIAYLGEYRFALPKYSYKLQFENGQLADPIKKTSLEDMAHQSIGKRLWEGKSTYREIAEKEGIRILDNKIAHAKTGDTVIWMSPPGAKSEGYGNYGFVFYGKVGDGKSSKDISMTAIRVNGEDLGQYNKAFQMLTGIKSIYLTPEQFISNPQVLNDDLPEGYVDAILGLTLGFRDSEEEKKKFIKVISALEPLIDGFAEYLSRRITLSEKEKAFFSLENYALKLKEDYEVMQKENIVFQQPHKDLRLRNIIGDYGYEPPKVLGSCGSTSKDSLTTSNILNKLFGINSLLSDDQEWFTCPKCDYQAEGPIGNTCPGCGLTKEEYAQKTGISCD